MQIKQAIKQALWNLRIAKETHNRARAAELRAFVNTYFPPRHKKHIVIY